MVRETNHDSKEVIAMTYEEFRNGLRVFIIKDLWTGHTIERNGNELRNTLYDMFPQSEGCTYRALDEIADFALSKGTDNPDLYLRVKALEDTLLISVSELI